MNLMEIDSLSSDRISYENENGEEIIPGKHTEIIQYCKSLLADCYHNNNICITFWKLQVYFTLIASFGLYHNLELFGGQIYFTDFKLAQNRY